VHDTGRRTVTLEEPCDYADDECERYYPVRTYDRRNKAVYARYKDLWEKEQNLRFIGRCGTYQYLDMDQVINQPLQGVQAWISSK
jgi:UDP-galactopyranose mutase